MATRLYLHTATAVLAGTLPSTQQSGLTVTESVDAASINRTMDTVKGTSQTSKAITVNQTTARTSYFTRFCSAPLNQTSIATNTWNFVFAAQQSATTMGFPTTGTTTATVKITAYVWRPSSGTKVADIKIGDSNGDFGSLSAVTTEISEAGTFAGSSVTCQVGDIICFEVIFVYTPTTGSKTGTFYYDGNTDPSTTDGTAASSAASYIETPENISFQSRTKLYFHDLVNAEATLPSTEQSTLTADKTVDDITYNRYMNTTIGTAQTSQVLTSNATVSQQNYYITRFVSDKLNGVTTINADLWEYAFAAAESNTSANFPAGAANSAVYINCYVWRPSGGGSVVGTILDGNSSAVYAEVGAASSERAMYGTFSGSQVTGISNGDMIVLEVWFRITQALAVSYTDTFYYDGTTENTTLNATVSNYASFISTYNTLAFTTATTRKAVVKSLTETITVSEAVTGLPSITGKPTNVKSIKTTITLDATSGVHDQSFTGFGFQPVAAIFYGTLQTATNTYNDGRSHFYGFSDGTNSCALAAASVDNVTTLDTATLHRNDACIVLMDAASTHTELIRGKVKTWDSDGLTITWNVKNTSQYIVHVQAFGGSDLTAKVAQTTNTRSGTGTQAFTGVGFKPNFLNCLTTSNLTMNTVFTGTSSQAGIIGMGFATDTTAGKQFANYVQSQDAVNTVNANISCNTPAQGVLYAITIGSSTVLNQASLSSFDTDGFTLNFTANGNSATPFSYLAIKGGGWDSGSSTTSYKVPTATGNQIIGSRYDETLVAAGIYQSAQTAFGGTSLTQNNTPIQFNIGGTDGTNEGCIASGDLYQRNTTAEVMISLTTKIIRSMNTNATATSTTTYNEADGNTFSGSNWTLNWTTVNANTNNFLYGWWTLGKSTAAAGQNITKSLTETVSISDSPTRQTAKIRAITETVSVPGTLARLTSKNRTLTETVATTGSLTRIKGSVKTLTETVNTTGTLSILRNKIRTLTETVSVPATLSRLASKNRTASDSITIAGTPVIARGKTRTISQTISISDALSILRNKIRAITQTVSISESPARQTSKNRSVSQSVSISDVLLRIKGSVKVITQTVSITDALNIARNKIRTITQTVSIGETPTRQTTKTRSISETVASSDAVARTKGVRAVVKTLTETITISDILSILRNKQRSITQTITSSENLTKSSGKRKSVSDSVSVSDALTILRNKIRVIVQTVTSSESLSKSLSKNRAISQSVSISDNANRLTQKKRSLTEIINIADLVGQTANKGIQHVVRIIDEARVVVSDAFYIQRTLNETVSVSDFVGQTKTDNSPTNFFKTLTESVVISDLISRIAGKRKSITENTTVGTDTATITNRGKTRPVTDSIHVSDSASCTKVQKSISKSLTENVNVSDSTGIQRGKVRRIGGPR